MKTAILIDSTAYIDETVYRDYENIFELGLETTFEDGVEFPDSADPKIQKEFYEKLRKTENLPKTSQPAPGKYAELIEEIIKQGYEEILCIHLSKTWSGTYQTATMIAEEYKDKINIHVVDSKAISAAIVGLVAQALDMIEKDVPFKKICENTEWSAKRGALYATLKDFDNLVKGGRMNNATAMIGSALKIRPIVRVRGDGEIRVMEKVRTDKRVNKRMAEIAKEQQEENKNGIILGFAHAADEERFEETVKSVHNKLPELDYFTGTLGPVIGTHVGIGTVGMATIPIAEY